jgi:hypothetical protein
MGQQSSSPTRPPTATTAAVDPSVADAQAICRGLGRLFDMPTLYALMIHLHRSGALRHLPAANYPLTRQSICQWLGQWLAWDAAAHTVPDFGVLADDFARGADPWVLAHIYEPDVQADWREALNAWLVHRTGYTFEDVRRAGRPAALKQQALRRLTDAVQRMGDDAARLGDYVIDDKDQQWPDAALALVLEPPLAADIAVKRRQLADLDRFVAALPTLDARVGTLQAYLRGTPGAVVPPRLLRNWFSDVAPYIQTQVAQTAVDSYNATAEAVGRAAKGAVAGAS